MNESEENFIRRFRGDAETVFTSGCCFWFAVILEVRFSGTIVYDEVMNHFGTRIGDRVFDITGDVTDKYNWVPWDSIISSDVLHAGRIIRDCVLFENE